MRVPCFFLMDRNGSIMYNCSMLFGELDAVGFDIDGTLYPAYRLNMRVAPFCIGHPILMTGFGKVRKKLHETGPVEDFFEVQAEMLSKKLGKTREETRSLLDTLIYQGWIKNYKKVRLYPGVKELLEECKAKGLKTGILSDFLPGQKLQNWGIDSLIDVSMGSEETNALKPSEIPFLKFAGKLGASPERILYVGNNEKLDCSGAKKAGMKTALISRKKTSAADITFKNYQELYNILFTN